MTRHFWILLFAFCAILTCERAEASIMATVAAEVKTGEIDDDLRFVNAQGTDNGNFSSYGVLEFDTTTLAGTTAIPGLQFSLTQANAFFTESGDISFFHMGDNAADLTPAGTLRSDPNAVPSAVPEENSLGNVVITFFLEDGTMQITEPKVRI